MHKALVAVFVLACLAMSAANAVELIRFEAPCSLGDAKAARLRQTIVVVDEGVLAAGPNAVQDNQKWSRTLLEIADALPGGQRGTMNPSERINVFLARQGGNELVPVFSGCSPNLSNEQRQKLETESSALGSFFSGGPSKQIADARKGYENAFIRAFGVMTREKQESKTAAVPNSFLRALNSAPRLIDLSAGIPRILMITPFALGEIANWTSQRAAREAGFEIGAQAGLDLQRAEVHVIGVPANANPHFRHFVEAFLLRSRGLLVGWRADGLPQLLAAPVDVRVFGGEVQIDAVSAPVQIRIAADNQGNLVNSWIEVTAGRSLATPISGKAICRAADSCEVKGDGRLMGQAWNTEPGERPIFNAQFAWSGLRYFEISISGNSGAVRIWDPSAKIQMGDKQLDDFRFSVQRTEKQQF